MLVPEYWAEHKQVVEYNGRKATIKRFGWSDTSMQDAQNNAIERVNEAIELFKTDNSLKRRERKVAYNGADGLPIREEIIKRFDDFVITRNSYGALCLNTPDVLFGDIDFPDKRKGSLGCFLSFCFFVLSFVLVFGFGFSILVFLSVFLGPAIGYIHTKFFFKEPDYETTHLESIKSIVAQNPDWRIRVYKTPNGYRILALHQLFDAQSEETKKFADRFKMDPVYRTMCVNQNCFRARVSPKPWRIGISDHLRPRPGVWPIAQENIPARKSWVKNYDEQSKDYAACKFLMELGSGKTDSKALLVQKVHDDYCRALKDLPIA